MAKVVDIFYVGATEDAMEGVTVSIMGHLTEAVEKAHRVCAEILEEHGPWRFVSVAFNPGALDSNSITTVQARVKPRSEMDRYAETIVSVGRSIRHAQ